MSMPKGLIVLGRIPECFARIDQLSAINWKIQDVDGGTAGF
jgi:hypothetical protein